MKKNFNSRLGLYILILFTIFACKKERYYAPLDSISEFKSVVEGSSVQLVWQSPSVEFDNFTLEVSKSPDFSILENSSSIDKSSTSHILRGLDLGEEYFARIRTFRNFPNSNSEWSNLNFTTKQGNILLPISMNDIDGNKVTIKWEFPENEPIPPHITKLMIIPNAGQAIEVQLTANDIANKSVIFDRLEKDVQYTVRIYNNKFLRGTEVFTTSAESVNGVWTLSPHSNLKAAVELSKTGDNIILKPGTYNFWLDTISIDSKNITIKAQETATIKPKLYVKNFNIKGTGTSITFTGVDLSGSRITDFKQEIPNSPDTRWNRWLISINKTASDFNEIKFDNCIIRNYYTGVLEMVPGQVGNSVTINNSIIHHTGEDQLFPLLSVGIARVKEGIFTNSTYYKTNKLFITVDNEHPQTKRPILNHINFTFKNNTVDNSWNHSAFDFKAGLLPTKVLLENNIFSNINCAQNFFSNFAQLANNFDKRLINCNFYNVLSKATIYGKNSSNMPVHSWELRHPNLIWNEVKPAFLMNDATHINPNSIKEYPLSIDPGYTDAANLNFTIPATSILRTVDGGKPIGDPRWW
jgi:hypothetical protein